MSDKIKKTLVFLTLLLLILSVIPIDVHADSNVINNDANEIVTYSEKVKMYYRMVNGREQKRLWSRTYGYWITAWMWV